MQREIKFRGWFQGINGTEMWVYGYLVKQTNGNWEITNGEASWTVDNVGQFTGYFDKNGKEIYEGDRLYICAGYSSTVEFQDGMFVSVYKHPEDGEIIPLLDAIGKDTVVVGDVF
ncbi:MAG: YopX family protein [Bacteroidales bacterium]